MLPKLQKRLFLLCAGFDTILWSPRPSRTPGNENERFSTCKNDDGMEFSVQSLDDEEEKFTRAYLFQIAREKSYDYLYENK